MSPFVPWSDITVCPLPRPLFTKNLFSGVPWNHWFIFSSTASLPDDCLITVWWLPDNCLTTSYKLSASCLTNARWLPDNSQMTAYGLPDNYPTYLNFWVVYNNQNHLGISFYLKIFWFKGTKGRSLVPWIRKWVDNSAIFTKLKILNQSTYLLPK